MYFQIGSADVSAGSIPFDQVGVLSSGVTWTYNFITGSSLTVPQGSYLVCYGANFVQAVITSNAWGLVVDSIGVVQFVPLNVGQTSFSASYLLNATTSQTLRVYTASGSFTNIRFAYLTAVQYKASLLSGFLQNTSSDSSTGTLSLTPFPTAVQRDTIAYVYEDQTLSSVLSRYFYLSGGQTLPSGIYSVSFWCGLQYSSLPVSLLFNLYQTDDTQGAGAILILSGSNATSTPIITSEVNLITNNQTLASPYSLPAGKYLMVEVSGWATLESNIVYLFGGAQYNSTLTTTS